MKRTSRWRLQSLLLLSTLPLLSHAQSSDNNVDWDAYSRGDLGSSPRRTYLSSDAVAPIIHVEQTSQACQQDSYVLLSFGTQADRGNQAMLVDGNGDLIWSHWERGAIHNLAIQKYRGSDYITYWVGDDDFYGHGHGYYKMYDDTYTLTYTLSAGNTLDGDFHEFQITSDNTALITAYVKSPWDLSFKERENGYIWDCVFQELDVETDAVLFEWRASDHFNFDDIAVDSWQPWTGHVGDPWDWFHINSVNKDTHGNYLVAARYTNAVTYISGQDGSILWHLGGKLNNFTDVGRGDAIRFVDPHMARWDVEDRSLTLFDNIAFWSSRNDEKASHGARIAVNPAQMKAGMVAEFLPPPGVFAFSEGSISHLENGNFFLGFGSSPYYAEFSPNGTLLCGARYAPPVIGGTTADERPKPNSVKSYRVFKHSWAGNPVAPPEVTIIDGFLYVSWNGATDVGYWKVAAKARRGGKKRQWRTLGTYKKSGFETRIPYDEGEWYGLHLTALDGEMEPFQLWYEDEDGDLVEIWDDSIVRPAESGSLLGGLVFAISSLTVLWLNRRTIMGSWVTIKVDPNGFKELWKS